MNEAQNDTHPDAAEHTVRIELGRRTVGLAELETMSPGRVVELDQDFREDVDVYVDGALFARGQAVVVGGRFGVRIGERICPADGDAEIRQAIAT